MKRVLTYIRIAVVSPEFGLILVATAVWLFWPHLIARMQLAISDPGDALKYLGPTPAGLFILIIREVRKVRIPEKDEKDELQDWERVWELKASCQIAILYGLLFVGLGVASWLVFDPNTVPSIAVLGLALSIFGSAVTWLSVYFAETKINETFSKSLSGGAS